MDKGGVDEAAAICGDTRGPIAAIFKQGLERSGGSYEELAKAVEDYGSLESTKLERGLSWISLFHRVGSHARLYGYRDRYDRGL